MGHVGDGAVSVWTSDRCAPHAGACFAAFLVQQLGVDPGTDLVELEAAILRHDPSLVPPPVLCRSSTTPALTRAWRRTKSMTPPCFSGRDAEVTACVALPGGIFAAGGHRTVGLRQVVARACGLVRRRGSQGAGGVWWCSPLVPIPAPLSVRLSIALASTQTPPERLWSISSRSCSPPSSQPPRPPRCGDLVTLAQTAEVIMCVRGTTSATSR